MRLIIYESYKYLDKKNKYRFLNRTPKLLSENTTLLYMVPGFLYLVTVLH